MPNKKETGIITYFLGGLTVIALAIISFSAFRDITPKEQQVLGEQTTQEEQLLEEENDPYYVAYNGQEGKTALELLREKATIKTQTSSYGEYVEEINEIKSGVNGKYWIFYVDGRMGEVGADQHQTTSDELIEWRFE